MTASVAQDTATQKDGHRKALLDQCRKHVCASHQFFERVASSPITISQAARLLKNYDAHATVLRRMLLKAASIMPEEAAGFILENVRNEYGNGNVNGRHQLQLRDLARKAGVTPEQFDGQPIEAGVKEYIRRIVPCYFPIHANLPSGLYRPAIAAGAITATEVMALEEFGAMQKAFAQRGLASHIWFDHVNVEAEHTDESLDLALHFIERRQASDAVYFGMRAVLDANVHLYDGFISALER